MRNHDNMNFSSSIQYVPRSFDPAQGREIAEGFADFSIEVSTSSIFADEVWEIVGTCDGAFSYSTVEISENSIFADLDVEITKNSIFADKQICIKNPNSLPDWFIEMLNEL